MKLSFRWYGADDKVTLENIRQIPKMEAIVTAVYDVPVGEVWSEKSIEDLKKQVEENGLKFEVIESIPVHEDIKLGKPDRDRYIENYCENIKRVAKAGVKCICYNFMPVFDWTRTQLDHRLPDGSTTLVYYQEQVDKVDPLKTDSDLTLPGWDASYSREELKGIVAEYQKLSEEDLWNNLEYFLKKIIPVAAVKAIEAMQRPTILIGGGYDKGSEFDLYVKAFKDKVKLLVLIGQTSEKIAATAKKYGFDSIIYADSMEEVVKICAQNAKPGDAVLLSPACASWGMFDNYEQRGRMFKDYVNAL